MDRQLQEGYSHFLENYFENHKELFENITNQQSPDTMLVTCSDSRINPALLLNAQPGELFIVRNIGNSIPPFEPAKGSTQAAVEYGVNALNIKKLVILGHSNCGACAHLYHQHKDGEPKLIHVDEWLKYLQPAKGSAILEVSNSTIDKNIFEVTEKHNVVLSLQRLMTYPYIQQRIENGQIELIGWWYNIGTGEIENYNYSTHQFEKINPVN
ncbi:MAG: carbonic anhydrase [Epsilonproteobacteria bacterium]|nr:carbonic anhydrase [Campylobacterota bacterium]